MTQASYLYWSLIYLFPLWPLAYHSEGNILNINFRFSIYLIFQLFFFQAFFCLISVGLILSLLLKYLVEKYLKNEELGFNKSQGVEFLYAFDIHCNSFVTFYSISVVLQFLFIPLINSNSLINTLISNGFVLIGIIYYCYVTLLGYYCNNAFII